MAEPKYTVAIIGCGRLGQHYAEVYQTLPNTELVAIAEYNPERRSAVGERFGIKALYPGRGSYVPGNYPGYCRCRFARQVHKRCGNCER